MFKTLLSIHVVAAIVGFGPAFGFAFLGVMAEKEPAYAHVLNRTVYLISTRLVIPVALVQGLSGVFLITNQHLDLQKNPWLGASIVAYVLLLGVSIFFQVPTERKLIALIDPARGSPPPTDQVKRLVNRVKFAGMGLGLIVVVIAVLMIWKPGTTV